MLWGVVPGQEGFEPSPFRLAVGMLSPAELLTCLTSMTCLGWLRQFST